MSGSAAELLSLIKHPWSFDPKVFKNLLVEASSYRAIRMFRIETESILPGKGPDSDHLHRLWGHFNCTPNIEKGALRPKIIRLDKETNVLRSMWVDGIKSVSDEARPIGWNLVNKRAWKSWKLRSSKAMAQVELIELLILFWYKIKL